MSLFDALILGTLQGLTEFIPVSSSAHLFLSQELLGHQNGMELLAFDLVLHLGTLVALVAVTWRDLLGMLSEFGRWIARKPAHRPADRALILPIVLGTIPGVLVGIFVLPWITEARTYWMIGIAMLVASSYFFFTEWVVGRRTTVGKSVPTPVDGTVIGLGQAAAGVFSGLSRSGFTICTGMLRGLSRPEAARFSFLLSIPIILGGGLKGLLDIADAGGATFPVATLVTGFLASAIAGYVAVAFLLRFLKSHTLRPFALYLGLLGLTLLVVSFVS